MPDSNPPRTSRQKPRGTDSLLARAGIPAGEGAERLFARLDAMNTQKERAAQLLARLAERVRTGEWTPEIAALVAQAEALERTLEEAPTKTENR